jgi:hypothetical protein
MKITGILSNILLFLIKWTPRVLSIFLITFTLLISYDFLKQEPNFWRKLIALLIHFIPTISVIVILIFSWKWPWIGALSFIILGFIYLIWYSPRSQTHYLDLSLFIIGTLFFLDWYFNKKFIKA